MVHDNNLSRQKQERLNKAIKDGGYYNRRGVWNSIVTFSGEDKIYRHRVETIVVRSGKEVFLKRKPDGSYFLPGGSVVNDKNHLEQAMSECQEEARINVANIKYSGISYKAAHDVPEWVKNDKFDIEWDGTYNEVYTADYDSKFDGHIDSVDLDRFISSGKWYSTSECFRFFTKEHREALSNYLKEYKDRNTTTTEGYISNFFSNKKLLKNISNKADVERHTIEELIGLLSKNYHSLSSTSKIRRERKRSDVSMMFHPISTIDFDDRCSIAFVLCFDDNESSPAAAFSTKEYGNIVSVYPSFFKADKESQIFYLLHEIGHVRLHHLENGNRKCDIFGNDRYLDYRISKIKKGKVMYPESNADLYAVLNGGKMYALLDTIKRTNTDKELQDYKLSNLDISNRYSKVLSKYTSLLNEDSVSRYDIACTALYESIEDIEYLDTQSKDMLYTIAYEYTIHKKIKDDKRYSEMTTIYNKKQDEYNKNKFIMNDTEKELFQESMNSYHVELLALKSILYDKKCEPINEDNFYGNNHLASYVSEAKRIFNIELTDKMEDLSTILAKENVTNSKKYLYLVESLTQAQRDKIPTHKFGIEDTRSYPLDTPKHVRSAVTLFNKAPNMYKKELATKIFNAIDKFKIDIDIGKDTELYKYK